MLQGHQLRGALDHGVRDVDLGQAQARPGRELPGAALPGGVQAQGAAQGGEVPAGAQLRQPRRDGAAQAAPEVRRVDREVAEALVPHVPVASLPHLLLDPRRGAEHLAAQRPQLPAPPPRDEAQVLLLVAPDGEVAAVGHEDAAGVRPVPAQTRGQAGRRGRLREHQALGAQPGLVGPRHPARPRRVALRAGEGQVLAAAVAAEAPRGALDEKPLHLPALLPGAAGGQPEAVEVAPELHAHRQGVRTGGVDLRAAQAGQVGGHGVGRARHEAAV
mmetsp:Transcript_51067/g.143760  ORF Transcript_51067/g.143760 Transcript_51067/m.143760 type:complete len:274 (+) Transcript_51067:173-994(+)